MNGEAKTDNESRLPQTLEMVQTSTAEYPQPVREAVRWLWDYGKRNGFSLSELGGELGRDGSLVSRVMRGKYEVADWQPILEDIERLRARVEMKERMDAAEFVETSTARTIWEAAELAKEDSDVLFVWGESQCGKSVAIQEYHRRHDDTLVVELPTGGQLKSIMAELSLECRLGTGSSQEDWRRRIFNAVSRYRLLILDEFDVLFTTPFRRTTRVCGLEFIREIRNRTRIGMLLIGTEEARTQVEQSMEHAVLRKLCKRSLTGVYLEPFPKEDLVAIAGHFGFPPFSGEAEDIIRKLTAAYGLKKYTSLLKKAVALARPRRPRWNDFVTVHDTVAKLGQRKEVK